MIFEELIRGNFVLLFSHTLCFAFLGNVQPGNFKIQILRYGPHSANQKSWADYLNSAVLLASTEN